MGFEQISCNLCGENDFSILSRHSREGRLIRTCLCKNCGLIYINPRMTREDYDKYYKTFYRQDRAKLKGVKEYKNPTEKGFESGIVLGMLIGRNFNSYLKSGLTIDIGSSSGGVLFGLKKVIPSLKIVGIEPSLEKAEFANKKGVKTYNCLFEKFNKNLGQVANIFCIKSLNHLLNPRQFLVWSYNSLEERGHLILQVKNFRQQCRRAGSIEDGVQIDHLFMFTPETLRLLVESIGFRVVFELSGEHQKKESPDDLCKTNKHHIFLIVEKNSETKPIDVNRIDRKIYKRLRWQLFNPYLKLYYLIFHSKKLSPLFRILRSVD